MHYEMQQKREIESFHGKHLEKGAVWKKTYIKTFEPMEQERMVAFKGEKSSGSVFT